MVDQVQIPNRAVPTHHVYVAELGRAGSQEIPDPVDERKDVEV